MNIIVTGTSRGIGYAGAEYLGKKGHQVFGLSRTKVKNDFFKSYTVDITIRQQVVEVVQEIVEKCGQIDVLINNAGVGMVGSVEAVDKKDIYRLFDLNFIAVIEMMSAILPNMRNYQSGKMINISSIASEMGLPFRGLYSASKAALDKITEAMRYELRPWNVQVSALHLGEIKTHISDSRIHSNLPLDYKETFDMVYESINKDLDKGQNPVEVAKWIEMLITKDNLKTHDYFAKPTEKASIPLKFLLPISFMSF
ncbi:MAG: SDR family NAD(P)-dependent oxidoreductase [Chitinophagales bacterium]|nr:SDR family NAD(P)-dependent oxidoreductase [Chitinophagales bacterium]